MFSEGEEPNFFFGELLQVKNLSFTEFLLIDFSASWSRGEGVGKTRIDKYLMKELFPMLNLELKPETKERKLKEEKVLIISIIVSDI